jgi:hypothetical protein
MCPPWLQGSGGIILSNEAKFGRKEIGIVFASDEGKVGEGGGEWKKYSIDIIFRSVRQKKNPDGGKCISGSKHPSLFPSRLPFDIIYYFVLYVRDVLGSKVNRLGDFFPSSRVSWSNVGVGSRSYVHTERLNK